MKSNDFCHWLEGFLEGRVAGLTEKEAAFILSKVKLVKVDTPEIKRPFPRYTSNYDFYRDNKWVYDRFNNSNTLIKECF